MRGDLSTAYPARPADVAEWEDVLLRYELGPCALRLALQDHAGAAEPLLGCLDRLVAAERHASLALDAMRRGEPVPAEPETVAEDGPEPADVVWRRYDAYAAARAHNFAALQRRGLGVWEWAAPLRDGGEVSAYQLVRDGLRRDGEVLAEVRAAARGGAPC
jgi:hypothetical protein